MRRFARIILCMLCACMMLVSCEENDIIDVKDDVTSTQSAETTQGQTESETTGSSVSADISGGNYWDITTSNGVSVREITIDSGKGGEAIEIVQLTDIHINAVTDEDLKDPVLKATYESRTWLRDFKSKANLERCLNYASSADKIIITGDIYDYLSKGAINAANEYIFTPYAEKVLACLGNHEPVYAMGESGYDAAARIELFKNEWCNDPYYHSEVLGNKVMVVVMDNGSQGGTGYFWDSQVPKLEADLKTARDNGYVVLLYYHIPISTGDVKQRSVKAENTVGDDSTTADYYTNPGAGSYALAGSANRLIYDLIVNNGDIIRGTFCGHHHNDYYTEIKAKTASGDDIIIPQYVVTGVPYGNGNVMKVTVK